MGVKDGFMGATITTKIAFFVVLLAVLVNWIAFCTTSWYVSTTTTTTTTSYTYMGLWRQCAGGISFSSSCTMLDGSSNDDMDAAQAFAIFGFMSLNVGFFLIILYMFWKSCKGNSETGLAAAITLFVSAGCWLIAVAVYGAKADDNPGRFGYSFALAVCALILALIGGIIMIVGGHVKSSVSSK